MYSRFGEVPPSLESVAQEIADRDNVKIMPTGSTAANILGISTQIPMTLSYLTTGSSRTINIGNSMIDFKHAAPKNFVYKGTTIPLIVQALRDLGEKNISEETLSSLSRYIANAKDKNVLSQDIINAPAWIQSKVKPLIAKINRNRTQSNG